MSSMRLTLTTLTDDVYQLEVSCDLELENFKALCEVESGIPAAEISLLHNGRPLYDDKKPLKDYGIADGDMLIIQHQRGAAGSGGRGVGGGGNLFGGSGGGGGAVPRRIPFPSSGGAAPMNLDFSSIQIPGTSSSSAAAAAGAAASTSRSRPAAAAADMTSAEQQRLLNDPVKLRDALLSRPEEVALLKERNPPLAEALLGGNLEKFTSVLRDQQKEREEREAEKIRMLNADPFDPDVQAKIAEEIRLRNVETNMETAMEYAPESFGQVTMLYIDCRVNGFPVKAFVDSGAQMTIMSVACAERCQIGRLVDRRWAGVAKGVGTQKIIGRVHLGQIQIGNDFLQSSFSILEDQPMDMLLGLDMLKRHQCCIDLKNNRLVIGTTGTETRFLSESDLPSCARLTSNSEDAGAVPMDEDEALAKALQNSAEDAAASNANRNNVIGGGGTSAAASSAPIPPAAANSAASASSSGLTDGGSVEETRPKRQALGGSPVRASLSSQQKTSTKPETTNSSSTSSSSAAAASGGASAVAATPAEASAVVDQSDLNKLTSMGFDRNDAEAQLRLNSGDINQTIAALIAKSLQF